MIVEQLAAIWTDILGQQPDGGSSFFELGGESVAAVRLASRVEAEIGVRLDVADIFEDDPTFAMVLADVASRLQSQPAA